MKLGAGSGGLQMSAVLLAATIYFMKVLIVHLLGALRPVVMLDTMYGVCIISMFGFYLDMCLVDRGGVEIAYRGGNLGACLKNLATSVAKTEQKLREIRCIMVI